MNKIIEFFKQDVGRYVICFVFVPVGFHFTPVITMGVLAFYGWVKILTGGE